MTAWTLTFDSSVYVSDITVSYTLHDSFNSSLPYSVTAKFVTAPSTYGLTGSIPDTIEVLVGTVDY